MGAGKWPLILKLEHNTVSTFDPAGFLIIVLVFVSRDSELDLSGDRKNFSSDLNEIWYVGRGRWVMHDGMPYGRIQGQGHESFKVWIPSIFKTYLLRHL